MDKDLDPGSYRDIALLNTDQKILTNILAHRLSLMIHKLNRFYLKTLFIL